MSGMPATSRIGVVLSKLSWLGRTTDCRAYRVSTVPKSAARFSQMYIKPNAAHTPHAEKLQRKK